MVLAEGLFFDFQGALVTGLGLAVAALLLVKPREVIQRDGNIGIIHT